MKKQNIIIDTDPGVDDAAAIIPALFDKRLNILHFLTVAGNVDVDLSTKNLLHILEFYGKNIPVLKGSEKPLYRETKDAKFIHGEEGLGNYKIKKNPTWTPLNEDAIEYTYKTIKKHQKHIILLLLGPATNIAKLFMAHPDCKKMIKKIVLMGTSDYGKIKITPYLRQDYISFNASSDPEALKMVFDSKIPVVVIPSEIGRASFVDINDLNRVKKNKIVGEMMFDMLNGYWEPNVDAKIVAMNDSCARFYITNPRIFKTKRVKIDINTSETPGKTVYNFVKSSNIKVVTGLNIKKFHKEFFKLLDKIEEENN